MIVFEPKIVRGRMETDEDRIDNIDFIIANQQCRSLNRQPLAKTHCTFHPDSTAHVAVIVEPETRFELVSCCCDDYRETIERSLPGVR